MHESLRRGQRGLSSDSARLSNILHDLFTAAAGGRQAHRPWRELNTEERGGRDLRGPGEPTAFRRIERKRAANVGLVTVSLRRKTMQKTRNARAGGRRGIATSDDVSRILGDLDPSKMLPILALEPTILDVEEASMWLAGDRDVFGPGLPLQGVPSMIVAILTRDEEEAEAEEGAPQAR
jgi:hypothetical protein